MGDSDDDGGCCRRRPNAARVIHAAKTMLPKLRIILTAMIVTCAAVLTLSAGMLGTRDPVNNLSGVPDISRALVREAVVEEPEWQQLQVLAYSRRADELMRLRDLPVTPVRAVVEYADQARARAAETASAPAAPLAAAPDVAAVVPTDSATAPALTVPASEPAPTIVATAPVATPPADAPSPPPADSGTAVVMRSANTPPVTVAIAPVANPPADTSAAPVAGPTVATPSVDTQPEAAVANAAPAVAPPADTAAVAAPDPAPAAAAAAPASASGDTQVAVVQPGRSETPEMYGPEKPKAEHKKPHGPKPVVHAHPAKPKKKPQVARPTRGVAPTASTGFTVDQQDRSSNTFGGSNNTFGSWRSNNQSSATR